VRGAEIRGFVAFAAVIVAIIVAWTQIENRESTSTTATSTTTTTTTIAPVVTTTPTPEQARQAICDRSDQLLLNIFLQGGGNEQTTTRLTIDYWTDMLDLVGPDVRVEVIAVVDYYEDYLATGGPFDFDTETIIADGDKERWEQLITRPASGLADARDLVGFLCGVELPDQARMDDDDFEDIEDAVLKAKRRAES
jgi:hypothetical protein